MELRLQDKIEVMLSLDENILVPASSYYRDRIFHRLTEKYKEFFKELHFRQINNHYFRSDELYYIFFDMHSSFLFETIRKENKYFLIPKQIREQLLNRYNAGLKENKALFEKIKENYIKILNEELPDSKF